MEKNQRQFDRIDKNFHIDISPLSYPLPKNAEEEGICKNISCGGIRFAVSKHYNPETLLSLKMKIMGFDGYKKPYSRIVDIAAQSHLTAIGQVVWCEKSPDNSGFEIGVRFVNIYEDDYRALQKYLKDSRKEL